MDSLQIDGRRDVPEFIRACKNRSFGKSAKLIFVSDDMNFNDVQSVLTGGQVSYEGCSETAPYTHIEYTGDVRCWQYSTQNTTVWSIEGMATMKLPEDNARSVVGRALRDAESFGASGNPDTWMLIPNDDTTWNMRMLRDTPALRGMQEKNKYADITLVAMVKIEKIQHFNVDR